MKFIWNKSIAFASVSDDYRLLPDDEQEQKRGEVLQVKYVYHEIAMAFISHILEPLELIYLISIISHLFTQLLINKQLINQINESSIYKHVLKIFKFILFRLKARFVYILVYITYINLKMCVYSRKKVFVSLIWREK